jgi:hypothetical protein
LRRKGVQTIGTSTAGEASERVACSSRSNACFHPILAARRPPHFFLGLVEFLGDTHADGVSQLLVPVVAGVLADHRRLDGRTTEPAHGLLHLPTEAGANVPCVAQVVEVQLDQAYGPTSGIPLRVPHRPPQLGASRCTRRRRAGLCGPLVTSSPA